MQAGRPHEWRRRGRTNLPIVTEEVQGRKTTTAGPNARRSLADHEGPRRIHSPFETSFDYFGSSVICISGSIFGSSSVVPAGYFPTLST
jgi:hypothetical protein